MFNATKYRNSSFIKFEKDQKVHLVLAGEPLPFRQNFQTKEYFPIDTDKTKEDGSQYPVKFFHNAFLVENNVVADKPKKVQFPQSTAEIIDERLKDRGPNIVLSIKKKGSPPKVTYDVEYQRDLTPEEAAKIAEAQLLPLKLPNPKEEFNSETYGS